TVLGPPQYAATRINLAQSTNGIGLLCGPIAGGAFFYSKNAAGLSTGSERLWIPYAFIGVIVIILAIVFYFAPMPDIEMEDDYHLDDTSPDARQSIWSHPHFWMAVLAQFLYVAAQEGLFRSFINYMRLHGPHVCPLNPSLGVLISGFFRGLLLHVNHVSDDLRAGDLRPWSTCEEGVVIHRHGDHGRGRAAESDGRCRRSVRPVTRLYRADALLRVRGVLRLHLAAAEQC